MLWIVSIQYIGEADYHSYFKSESAATEYFRSICIRKNVAYKIYTDEQLETCMTRDHTTSKRGVKYYVDFNQTVYMRSDAVLLAFREYDDV